ncbi:hypothetical protein [Catenuloplanes atrovinosus]|uniref:Uncharacterized protein n=1 Tax=Catenuloplanes atrovinosus TaxID=137266 RepID=A0AAE3YSH4_9ACTN|nr:hypothetical protein [Catenuloplanes atrovinosus]MDR7279079.1 hypothetical protein [Catenuloplanes atrovinosus]
MRMVWTDAPEDDFYPARDRLVDAFTRWARRAGRDVDPFMAEVLIEQRWSVGDGRLCRWQPDDLRYALLEYFPRGVTTREWSDTIPTMHAFVDFLFDADLADAKCADADVLHAVLNGLAAAFDAAMADETRYGPAKFWSMRMLDAGINLDDQDAMSAFIADVQAGKVPYDQTVLDRVVENQLTEEDETPPALPPIDPPTAGEVADAAAESIALTRLLRFTEWVGEGRELTRGGALTPDDAAEVSALIDPASDDGAYEAALVLAWAREARFVRVVKGRLVPVKAAAKLVTDRVAAAHRAFEAFHLIGRAVCPPDDRESIVPYRADDFTFALLMAMYLAQRPIEYDELEEIVGHLADDFAGAGPGPEDAAARDVQLLLTQLDLLGAIRHDPARTSLTPFGTALFQRHLRGMGIDVPTVDDVLDETAEVVVALAADTPTIAGPLLTRWRDHRPEAAVAELRALAARTDDPEHRALAETYGGRRLASRPHAVSARRPKKRRR